MRVGRHCKTGRLSPRLVATHEGSSLRGGHSRAPAKRRWIVSPRWWSLLQGGGGVRVGGDISLLLQVHPLRGYRLPHHAGGRYSGRVPV